LRRLGAFLRRFRQFAAVPAGKAIINQIDRESSTRKTGSPWLPSDRVGHLLGAARIALARCWMRLGSPRPPLAPIGFRSLRRRSAVATPVNWPSGVGQKPRGAEPKQIKDLGPRGSAGTDTNEHPTGTNAHPTDVNGRSTVMNGRQRRC
jgi:hypothetical protein